MPEYTETDKELLHHLKTVVKGNGTKGHEGRITDLEENCNEINCRGNKAVKQHITDDHKGRKAEWIRDATMIMQLLALLVVLFKLFMGKP